MPQTVTRAYGFKPLRYMNGAAWNGACNQYLVPSTDSANLFIGDAVTHGSTAGAAGVTVNGVDCEGMPVVVRAAAADTQLVGVVVGFLSPQATSPLYGAGSTNRIALVCDDPNVIYQIQEDAVGNSIQIAGVGANYDLVAGAGSTTTGVSGMMLDSSDTSGASTAQLRLLRLARSDMGSTPNTVATAATAGNYADWEVMINEHYLRTTSGIAI